MLNKIKNDLKEAMKSGDKEKLNPLRNLVSKIKMKEIEIGRPLKDEESLKVCNSVAKQIKESIIQFDKGGRQDLSDNEKNELKVIEAYLPEQLPNNEILKIVKEIINNTGASSLSDMGKIMGMAMNKLDGQADGKVVQKLVLNELKK